jgi:hypothetical protein
MGVPERPRRTSWRPWIRIARLRHWSSSKTLTCSTSFPFRRTRKSEISKRLWSNAFQICFGNIEIGRKDYYLDLLFYHTRLHSYVVVDLKIGDFQPEYAGKMNFYLSAVDDLLRVEGDNSSIGLILCKGKNGLEVEYALRDINKPIAVSEYRFLPVDIATELPSPSELRRVGELLDDVAPPEDESMSGPSTAKP